MRTRQGVALAVIVAFYLTLVGPRASLLMQAGEPLGRLIAVVVLLVPLAGGWFVWRELRYARLTQRLADEYDHQVGGSGPELSAGGNRRPPRSPTMVFAAERLAVETSPNDWAAWYRLALAYDAVGDRSSGRTAMRHAATLQDRALHDQTPST